MHPRLQGRAEPEGRHWVKRTCPRHRGDGTVKKPEVVGTGLWGREDEGYMTKTVLGTLEIYRHISGGDPRVQLAFGSWVS